MEIELDQLTPDKVNDFIIPDFKGLDNPALMRLAEQLRDLKDHPGFRTMLHLVAVQYQDVLGMVISPVDFNTEKGLVLKGRLWGLGEILDLPGAVEDRAQEIIKAEQEKAKNPTTGGGR